MTENNLKTAKHKLHEMTQNIPSLVIENLFRHKIITNDLDEAKIKETILKTKEYFDYQVYRSEKEYEFDEKIDKNAFELSEIVSKIQKKNKRKKRKNKK